MALLVVMAGVATGAYLITNHLTGNIKRINGVFAGINPSERPAAAANGDQTVLIVGHDNGHPDQVTIAPTQNAGGPDADTIMIARVKNNGVPAGVVNVPYITLVDVPDHGTMKINDAYRVGGPTLLVRTVEALTGIRVDHFMIADFSGFQSIVDLLGGVDVQVRQATAQGNVTFVQGVNRLDGAAALSYVRQEKGIPDGDLNREFRSQNLVRSILAKMRAEKVYQDPPRVYQLIDAATKMLTVDETFTMTEMQQIGMSVVKLQLNQVSFVRAPIASVDNEDNAALMTAHLDQAAAQQLWKALAADKVAQYAKDHPSDELPAVPY